MKPRPYQEKAAQWLSRKMRGMIIAPAGSGKSLLAARALEIGVKRVKREEIVKIGWLCRTEEQRDQAYAAINHFPSILPFIDFKAECAASNTDWSDRHVLVVDECQYSGSSSWAKSINTCKGAIWFFSATPWTGDDERDDILKRMCELNIYEISKEEVAGNMSKGGYYFHELKNDWLKENIDTEIDKRLRKRFWQTKYMPQDQLWGQIAFQTCIELGIQQNRERNLLISQLAQQNTDRTILIIVAKIDHGKELKKMIPNSELVYSKVGKKFRREVIEDTRKGNVSCLISSSLADEGLDIPVLDMLIMACSGKNMNRTIQRTGRVMRKHEGKDMGIIHDFNDLWHPLAAKHSQKREEVYIKQGYEKLV